MQRLYTGATDIDCIALVPGPNLVYLTGLHFHLSERPIIALFPRSGQPALLVPTLEAIKAEHAARPLDWLLFPYDDEDGPDGACARACAALELAGKRLAIERLTMRVLELEMLQRDAPGVHTVAAEPLLAELRMRKNADELANMRRAAQIAQDALARTLETVRPGMTEQHIAG